MSDYAALAQRVSAGVSGIRGCLLLSRDGMVLGAYPEGDTEAKLKTAWLRFAAVGEADRSHVEFPDQTWAFVRRGGYAAFVIADVGVRPGILVDLLEQALVAGEVERVQDREAMRLPEAPVAPSGKPRTRLHKPERVPATQPETVTNARVTKAAGPPRTEVAGPPIPDEPETERQRGPEAEAQDDAERPPAEDEEETEVDRILLAKEFAGLLQVPRDDDEATR
jgi:hypothetical protein